MADKEDDKKADAEEEKKTGEGGEEAGAERRQEKKAIKKSSSLPRRWGCWFSAPVAAVLLGISCTGKRLLMKTQPRKPLLLRRN